MGGQNELWPGGVERDNLRERGWGRIKYKTKIYKSGNGTKCELLQNYWYLKADELL